jgi:hypothetical protein
MYYTQEGQERGRPSPPDVLKGAREIANFLFGTPSRRREVYYLTEKSSLPVFKLGAMICARRSTLEAWIASQEQQGVN